MAKNFIKDFPEGEIGAIDETLLLKQLRFRKGTLWHKHFDLWYSLMMGEIDLDDYCNKFEELKILCGDNRK